MENSSETAKTKVKTIKGLVVSDAMEKTVVVLVEYRKMNKRFRKSIIRTKKIMADDPEAKAKKGDTILISACRPISKRKKFQVAKVLSVG